MSGQVADKQGGGSEPARPLHSLLSEQPLQARPRLEYHLTADSLLSQTVRLNGQPLLVTPEGKLPALEPEEIPVYEAIVVQPLSIVFVAVRDAYLPACFF